MCWHTARPRPEQRATAALAAFQLDRVRRPQVQDATPAASAGGVDIALGIIHAPKVVFLDEPTTGLDPQSRAHMWDEIRRLRAEGMTVFLTTHYLDEADALCDRHRDHGPRPDRRRGHAGRAQAGDHQRRAHGGTGPRRCQPRPRCSTPTTSSTSWRADPERRGAALREEARPPSKVLRSLDQAGIALASIELHRPSLDDVFLTRTGRSLRES